MDYKGATSENEIDDTSYLNEQVEEDKKDRKEKEIIELIEQNPNTIIYEN
jgi:hypothetical protein